MAITPCFYCTEKRKSYIEKEIACHGICEEYIEWKNDEETRKDKIRQARIEEGNFLATKAMTVRQTKKKYKINK